MSSGAPPPSWALGYVTQGRDPLCQGSCPGCTEPIENSCCRQVRRYLLPPPPCPMSLASAVALSTGGGGVTAGFPQRHQPSVKEAEQRGQPEPLAYIQAPC